MHLPASLFHSGKLSAGNTGTGSSGWRSDEKLTEINQQLFRNTTITFKLGKGFGKE